MSTMCMYVYVCMYVYELMRPLAHKVLTLQKRQLH